MVHIICVLNMYIRSEVTVTLIELCNNVCLYDRHDRCRNTSFQIGAFDTLMCTPCVMIKMDSKTTRVAYV